jgi:hypothetical protein
MPVHWGLRCASRRRWLSGLIELCFTNFMASEIVAGYTSAHM